MTVCRAQEDIERISDGSVCADDGIGVFSVHFVPFHHQFHALFWSKQDKEASRFICIDRECWIFIFIFVFCFKFFCLLDLDYIFNPHYVIVLNSSYLCMWIFLYRGK